MVRRRKVPAVTVPASSRHAPQAMQHGQAHAPVTAPASPALVHGFTTARASGRTRPRQTQFGRGQGLGSDSTGQGTSGGESPVHERAALLAALQQPMRASPSSDGSDDDSSDGSDDSSVSSDSDTDANGGGGGARWRSTTPTLPNTGVGAQLAATHGHGSKHSNHSQAGHADRRRRSKGSGARVPRGERTRLIGELQRVRQQCTVLMEHMERELAEGTRPFIEEVTTPFAFLYEPHTVTALLLALGIMCYVAFLRPPDDPPEVGIKLGVATAGALFLVYCVTQLRDSMMLRPHPAFWRLVHGCCILYLLGLVFMLCQTRDNAQRVLEFVDPSLAGASGRLKEYATDCRLYTPGHPAGNFALFSEALTSDIFMLAHFLGWVGKALMLRDWTLCWILCILWELVEYSFQHMMGNFYECWWDHWILDVLLCNFGGMALGMAMCRYFAMKQYNWTGTRLGRGATEKVMRVLEQFSPYSWTKYTWDIFSSFRRFLSVMFLILCATIIELNAFYFMELFHLLPAHPLNNIRLLLWFLLCIACCREFFQYLVDDRQRRLGVNVWIALAVISTECLIVLKFQDDMFTRAKWPDLVLQCWAASLACITAWALLKFDVVPCFRSSATPPGTRGHSNRSLVVNVLFLASLPPLVYLVYSQDVGYGRDGRAALAAVVPP